MLPTKPFDLIRMLVVAFTAALTADSADKAQASDANTKLGDLQKALDANNGVIADLKAKLAADDTRLADLGEPLSDDETTHLSSLLATLASQPPAVIAAPVPPVVETAPVVPVNETPAGDAPAGDAAPPAGEAVPANEAPASESAEG